MTAQHPRVDSSERVHTGVPGLDAVLGGGLLRGGVYIVTGAPGTGKTLLANQVAFAQAREGGRCLYVTLLAESHARMMAYLRPLGFFAPERVPHDVYYVSAFRTLEEGGLQGLLELLRRETRQHGTRLLVLDGLAQAEETAGSGRELKKFVHELQTFSDLTRCTVLLLTHPHAQDLALVPAQPPEQTMVDGILELRNALRSEPHAEAGEAGAGEGGRRSLTVRKFRGSATLPGSHLLGIGPEGVRVWPRLESQVPREPPAGDGSARVHLGVTTLDAMLPEGVGAGSLTLVLGPSGAGKTLLGLHFLAEGLAKGEPALLFNFEESPERLLRSAGRVGLALQGPGFRHLWQLPVDDALDALGERLLEAVAQQGTRRLVIDGFGGLQAAEPQPGRLARFLPALVQALRSRGVSVLLTAPDAGGDAALRALADNLVLLRLQEHHAHTRRLVSVLKVRDADFDSAVREFVIGAQGLDIRTPLEGSEALLAGLAREAPGLP
jgi:circadian clock protein KaiC